jgi:hypothetical protein
MADFEDDFDEYAEYGDEFGEEDNNEFDHDFDSSDQEEEDKEDSSEELKSALSKLNKNRVTDDEKGRVWHLLLGCRIELYDKQDFEKACLILKAIQKLIEKEYIEVYYGLTLVIMLHLHASLISGVSKSKSKSYTKQLKSLVAQAKVLSFASKLLSLHDLKTLGTSSTIIPTLAGTTF